MNGYVCFYNSKRLEIHAKTPWEAKDKVIAQLKVPKSKQGIISVNLAEVDGKQVLHTPDF